MDIEIVAIGDEVLYGYTINSNASYIARALLEAGFVTTLHTVCGDDAERLGCTLSEALRRKSFVITCGGLGPTCDDHTRQVIAELFGVPLRRDPLVAEWIENHFGKVSTLDDQSMVPTGAQVLFNTLGTAPGFLIGGEAFPESVLLALPGVPFELYDLVDRYLVPIVRERVIPSTALFIEPLHFIHLSEAIIDPVLRSIEERYPAVHCGIYPGYGIVSVHLRAEARDRTEFGKIIAEARGELTTKFRDYLLESGLMHVEEAVHRFCIDHTMKLGLAESCTGGALAARFVALADASRYFQGGVVAYSNAMKEALLGVRRETLEQYGAVSQEVTREMAEGVLDRLGVDVAVSVSGILGPTGGSEAKPVGTVAATILLRGVAPVSWTMHLKGNRLVIREKAIETILSSLLFFLRKNKDTLVVR
jgi:nicotinamide-nucleotide amidase